LLSAHPDLAPVSTSKPSTPVATSTQAENTNSPLPAIQIVLIVGIIGIIALVVIIRKRSIPVESSDASAETEKRIEDARRQVEEREEEKQRREEQQKEEERKKQEFQEFLQPYNQQIEQWKTEGYDVRAFQNIANQSKDMVVSLFEYHEKNITLLKRIEKNLRATKDTYAEWLKTGELSKAVQSIESNLKSPQKAEDVEKEYFELKRNLQNAIEQGFGKK